MPAPESGQLRPSTVKTGALCRAWCWLPSQGEKNALGPNIAPWLVRYWRPGHSLHNCKQCSRRGAQLWSIILGYKHGRGEAGMSQCSRSCACYSQKEIYFQNFIVSSKIPRSKTKEARLQVPSRYLKKILEAVDCSNSCLVSRHVAAEPGRRWQPTSRPRETSSRILPPGMRLSQPATTAPAPGTHFRYKSTISMNFLLSYFVN